jgi:hypothetical protein
MAENNNNKKMLFAGLLLLTVVCIVIWLLARNANYYKPEDKDKWKVTKNRSPIVEDVAGNFVTMDAGDCEKACTEAAAECTGFFVASKKDVTLKDEGGEENAEFVIEKGKGILYKGEVDIENFTKEKAGAKIAFFKKI